MSIREIAGDRVVRQDAGPMTQMSLFSPPFSQYVEKWDAAYNRAPWVTSHTAALRRGHLRLYVLPRWGAGPIEAITVAAVTEWQGEMLSRGLSVGYVKHVATSFSAVMAQAYRDGLIALSPLKGMKWPKRNSARPDPYTPTEIRRLVRWFKRWQPDSMPLIALVCLAGMRPSEACGLRWTDLDLESRTAKIERSAVNRVLGEPKTRRSRRRIRLTLEVVEVLRAADRRSEWVCTSPDGRQIASALWGGFHFRRACGMAGVRYRGFYRGRAAFMTNAAQKGANLLALSEYSGTSVRMLEDHYLRWLRVNEVPGESRRRRHNQRL